MTELSEPRYNYLSVLSQAGLIGGYYGPRYYSWTSVQDYMCQHPRGRGLRGGSRNPIYLACRAFQADRSRSKSWRPRINAP